MEDDWKRRYLDLVRESEEELKALERAQHLLHRVAARLALVAEGVYPDVDPLLADLRRALRDEDAAAVDRALHELEALLRSRDLGEPPVSAAEFAAALLDALRAHGGTEPPEALAQLAEGRLRRRELAALARALAEAATRRAAAPQAAPAPSAERLRTALLGLVARLEGCEPVAVQGQGLARRIEEAEGDGALAVLLEEAADLVGAAIDALRHARDDVARLLAGVDERLAELAEAAEGVRTLDAERREAAESLEAAVHRETAGLRAEAAAATDLEALRRSIETRLTAIERHLREHGARERAREERAEGLVRRLLARLREAEGEIRGLRERLGDTERALGVDPLTGIANRRAWEARLGEEVERWRRYRTPLALAVADVDRFKAINDGFGHRAGDKVLRTLAQYLRRRLRRSDFVARYGGEEFAILLPQTDLEAARRLAEALREAVAALGFHYRERPVPVTVSIGVTELREGDDAESAFERADRALYEAKRAGRNRVVAA